jgi:hypothetical protein
MVEAGRQRRYRLSIRALMIAIALCALFLVPLAWMYRQLELQRRMEMVAVEHARALADERAAALARFTQAGFRTPKPGNTVQSKTDNLWAALTVNHSTFKHGQTKDLRIEFSLVNDGDKVIDPKISESHIVINGKELVDSGSILKRSLKETTIRALSPGDTSQFGVVLGDHFNEPGLYQVSWKGVGFQSSEVALRILPEKAR